MIKKTVETIGNPNTGEKTFVKTVVSVLGLPIFTSLVESFLSPRLRL